MSERRRQLAEPILKQPDSELANYLDTLLAEIDEGADLQTEQPVKEPPQKADTLLESPAPAVSAERGEDHEGAAVAVPDWAQSPFQILRFRVSGVDLVVPLMSLKGIVTINGSISRLPGQPPWSLGVITHLDEKVVVVDTRRLLKPDGAFEEANYSHLLLIGEGTRGLAVEGLGETVTVDSEAIRWPGDTRRHPWYGGILIEELSVLLDVKGLTEMLAA